MRGSVTVPTSNIRYAASTSYDCVVIKFCILHSSAMVDYEGDDMNSGLLCDEIALLELYVSFP